MYLSNKINFIYYAGTKVSLLLTNKLQQIYNKHTNL